MFSVQNQNVSVTYLDAKYIFISYSDVWSFFMSILTQYRSYNFRLRDTATSTKLHNQVLVQTNEFLSVLHYYL